MNGSTEGQLVIRTRRAPVQAYAPINSSVWRPRQPIAPVSMTAEEAASRPTEMLAEAAKNWGIEPDSPPDLVRWVTYEESVPTAAACMEEKGFSVQWADDGLSYTITGLGKQETSAYQADDECLAMYSPDPRLDVVTPERLGLEWDFYTEWVLPCLADHGAEVLVPLPSREVYIGTQGDWKGYPFGQPRLLKACRPGPPSLALLGIPYQRDAVAGLGDRDIQGPAPGVEVAVPVAVAAVHPRLVADPVRGAAHLVGLRGQDRVHEPLQQLPQQVGRGLAQQVVQELGGVVNTGNSGHRCGLSFEVVVRDLSKIHPMTAPTSGATRSRSSGRTPLCWTQLEF